MVWIRLPETSGAQPLGVSAFIKSYFELIKSTHFWAYTLIMAFSIGAFFVFISGVPLVAVEQLDMSQSQIGLAIGSMTVGFLIGSFLSAQLTLRLAANTVILLGRSVTVFGLLSCFVLIWSNILPPWALFGGAICAGLGNGLTIPSASSSILFDSKNLAASASGLFGAVIVVFGAVFSTITGVFIQAQPTALALIGLMLLLSLVAFGIAVWMWYGALNTKQEQLN